MATINKDEVTGETFIVEGEDEDEDLQDEDTEETSAGEPEGQKQETSQRSSSTGGRSAKPLARVEVSQVDEESDDESDEDEDLEDDEFAELEEELDSWFEDHVAQQTQAQVARVQSTKDREIAKAIEKADALQKKVADLEDKILEGQLSELSAEDQEILRSKRALDKEKAEVAAATDELDALLKEREVEALVTEYGDIGVTADELNEIDDPDEMEAYCKRALRFFERAGGVRGGKASTEETKPKAQASTQRQAKPAKATPAGASAPSDIGGGSPALGKTRNFEDGQGLDVMARNLNNIPEQVVRIG